MIEVNIEKKEKAILVAVSSGDAKETTTEYLNELSQLAETAGAEVIIKVSQDKGRFDPAFYVGKGKAEELSQLADMNEADLIIFDDDLSPVQVRNLEKVINKKIVDRSGLILDIFASRARTKEAKTQVELAQLQYMLPRLTRAWTHFSKQLGGIGTKGPGETQIETDRRIIRTRISSLKEKLLKIESQRQTKSAQRKNFVRASLVGYTNAGKSTLMNLLTEADTLAENKLFATLDSTTRLFELDKSHEILISDTVGFIRKLPHHLVASFKSTLNEVRESDIILHVIDVSHPYFEDHMSVVKETLNELGCQNKKEFKIFNKVDALEDPGRVKELLNKYENAVFISAARGINISKLKEMLIGYIESEFTEETISLTHEDQKKIAQIHSLAEVLSIDYDDDKVVIKFKADKKNYNKLKSILYEH
ncbi:MAG TPA: GTPase HflX [Ignavibacteriales bacterium]|nr:GTPase HflX [Ignavibacteriales bacterium]